MERVKQLDKYNLWNCKTIIRKSIVDGYDIIDDYRETRSRIGLVPQELTLEQFETVFNNVSYSRGLYGKTKPCSYRKNSKQLSLWDKKDQRLRQLSGGMKKEC